MVTYPQADSSPKLDKNLPKFHGQSHGWTNVCKLQKVYDYPRGKTSHIQL